MAANTLRDLYVFTCAACGVRFGIDNDFDERRREDGKSFWCPNGHVLSYKDSEVTKLRRSLQLAQEAAIAARDEASREAKRARVAQTAAKRETTRRHNVEAKIARGVRPFGCRRHFTNVERHVATKHPGERAK